MGATLILSLASMGKTLRRNDDEENLEMEGPVKYRAMGQVSHFSSLS